MAKLKFLKLPKKPKASASLVTMENWLKKCEALKAENRRRNGINTRAKQLRQRIAGIGNTYVLPGSFSVRTTVPYKRKRKASVGGHKRKGAKRKK